MQIALSPSAAPPCLEFSTRSTEVASERVSELFSRANVQRARPGGSFSMRLQAAKAGAVTLTRIDVENCEVARRTESAVVVLLPQTGGMSAGARGRRSVFEPRKSLFVGRPNDEHAFGFERAVCLSITAPMEFVEQRVELLSGGSASAARIGMANGIDAGTAVGQALFRSANAALAEVTEMHRIGLGGLATGGFEEILGNLLAAALFPQCVKPAARVADCGPVVVRRARDHIRERAAYAVDIARLAADLGVSMRSLQQNFKRSYGVSPRDYLMRIRLENARESLLRAERALTVCDIAFASGFSDLSHFSAKYRDAYGELPSETLRFARSH